MKGRETKVCTSCRMEKPETGFYWVTDKRRNSKVRHSKCQECRRKQFSVYAKTENGKKVKRRGFLRREYGISDVEYDHLLKKQGCVCAICGKPETKILRGKLLDLSVDHDHDTGVVRGLLCQKCNVGLGSFEDNPDALRAAADYLDKCRKAQAA